MHPYPLRKSARPLILRAFQRDPCCGLDMRTTLPELYCDRHDSAGFDEPSLARDHPRRRRDPLNELEEVDRRGGLRRLPSRHGNQRLGDVPRRAPPG